MIRFALLGILASTLLFAHAQETAPSSGTDAPTANGESASPVVIPVNPKPAEPRGDILTLKSGQVIEGLQVLRVNSANYVLEIIDGITLDIPRRQVVSVDYDDFDPKLHRRKSAMIHGQRLSDALETKLDTDISDPPFDYQNADLLQVLSEIESRVDGILTLDPSVEKTMSPASRSWTVASEPGMTLEVLLRRKLLADFPNLAISFNEERISITTKEAAAAPASFRAGQAIGPPGGRSAADQPRQP